MRLDEIMKQSIFEMSFSRAEAKAEIAGLRKSINLHLIKLLVVENANKWADHWKHEIGTWLYDISIIRLKPERRTAPAKFYYDGLFETPFGGNEIAVLDGQLMRISRDYTVMSDIDKDFVVSSLKSFHMIFAKACASGTLNMNGIEALLEDFGKTQT